MLSTGHQQKEPDGELFPRFEPITTTNCFPSLCIRAGQAGGAAVGRGGSFNLKSEVTEPSD